MGTRTGENKMKLKHEQTAKTAFEKELAIPTKLDIERKDNGDYSSRFTASCFRVFYAGYRAGSTATLQDVCNRLDNWSKTG